MKGHAKESPRCPRRCRRRGAVLVEFALVGTLFFMLCLTAVEFARFSMIHHLVDNGAYEAARAGIVPGATAADVQNTALDYLAHGFVNGTTVVVNPAVIDEDTPEVTVTVSVPFNENSWGVPQYFTGVTVTATATLRAERFRGN